jgi:hypothetical protein
VNANPARGDDSSYHRARSRGPAALAQNAIDSARRQPLRGEQVTSNTGQPLELLAAFLT